METVAIKFREFDRDTEKDFSTKSGVIVLNQKTGIASLRYGAARRMGVIHGDRVKLLNIGRQYFLVQSDSDRAFLLSKWGTGYNIGVRFCSLNAINTMFEDLGIGKGKAEFYVQRTKIEHCGYPVFELVKKNF
jgi:hypothetical protein